MGIQLAPEMQKIPRKIRRAIARHDTKFILDNSSRMDFQQTPRKKRKIFILIKEHNAHTT